MKFHFYKKNSVQKTMIFLALLCNVYFFVPNINAQNKTETKKTDPKKVETKKVETKKTETNESNFVKLLKNFPVVTVPKKITNEEILKATQKGLDNQLAWEFFFEKNKAFKLEDTHCYPLVQFNVSEKTVGVIYIKGKNNGKGNTFYAVFMKGYHKKTGTLISTSLMPFTTLMEDGAIVAEIDIKPKGLVAFTENNTKLEKKYTQNIQIKE